MQTKILSLILLILSISLNAREWYWAGDGKPDEQTIRAHDLGNELIRASANGNLERVKYLVINTSVDINYAIEGGSFYVTTALSCSITNRNLEMIKFLVNNGANINLASKRSSNLVLAVEKGNLEIIRFLIDNGADIDGFGYGASGLGWSYSALMYSAYNGNLQMVNFLLNKKANINLLTRNGYSALNYAIKKGNLEMVKFLVNKGANVNPNSGCPPLISALEEEYPRAEHFEIVKFLISNRANVNVFYGDKLDISRLDLSRPEGLFLLYFLTSDTPKTHADILREGSTPLTLAVRGGNLQIVKFLVDNKADINTVGYGGKTPISIAKERGWRDIISYLRMQGASE